ncbi:MAG: hypothetical protein QNK37_26770 [Acidobacteriota bacterium]|nr:hypothetical protein [Acidobacteriota bacterium]
MPSLKVLLLIGFSCLFWSCGKDAERPKTKPLLPQSAFALDLPNSEFAMGKGFSIDPNYLYVSDGGSHTIKQYSHAGKGIRSFGGIGEGPGEFASLQHLTVRDGLVFALDRTMFINVFDNQGEFIDKIHLSSAMTETRAAVDAEMNIYIATPRLSSPISVYNLHGAYQRGFGRWLGDRPEDIQRLNENARFLFINEAGNLISVSRAKAHIEIYAHDGILLRERQLRYDRHFLPFFTKVDDYYEEKPWKWERSTFEVVRDVVLIRDQLLILHCGDDTSADNLMIVDVSEDRIGQGRHFKLKGKDGSHITSRLMAAEADRLHVYDSRLNWIYLFKLPSS